jgi:hypothetical protein
MLQIFGVWSVVKDPKYRPDLHCTKGIRRALIFLEDVLAVELGLGIFTQGVFDR